MDCFTIIILLLLILSIANNFIMYNKCYLSNIVDKSKSEKINESQIRNQVVK